MSKKSLVLILGLVVAIGAFVVVTGAQPLRTPAATLEVGDEAPDLDVKAWLKNGPLEIEDGTVYVVEFWATWCPPCRTSIPHLTELQEKYEDDVKIIGITTEDRETVEPFVKQMGDEMEYAVAIDGDGQATTKAYFEAAGLRGIPSAFIVDKSGEVAWIGHPMEPKMEEMLKQLAEAEEDESEAAGNEDETTD
jgi:thiol-disulfide isomerase/thioredoxin